MLHDFEQVESPVPGAQDRVNVCILGAGAAGILLATELAAQGLSVLLVEGGGLSLEPRSQELYRADITGFPYTGATRGRFRTFGGSTTQWGGQIMELDDFTAREHVQGSGWPFSKTELTSFYGRALRFEGLRLAEPQDSRVWAGLGLSLLDLGPEFRMRYSRWCPERDFSILHGANLRDSRRLQVLYHANATAFVLNEGRTAVRAVRARGYSGREALLHADRFVLALGGIESNRLLLQPLEEGTAPWQRSGLLGCHFHDHIALNRIPILQIATQPAQRYFGYTGLDGFRYHNKVQLSAAEQSEARTLNVAGTIGPFFQEDFGRDDATVLLREVLRKGRRPSVAEWRQAARYLPGIGWQTLRQRLAGEGAEWLRTMLTVHSEQSPRSASSISLSHERDALGLLRVRLDWQISQLELHTLRSYVRRATEVFAARRFARVLPPRGFYEDDALVRSLCSDSYHHMGGARMAATAAEGIVDPQMKLHGIDNLYVCSSAVFPSGGFSNPTHTLLALAMRLGDHLRDKSAADGLSVTTQAAASEPMRSIALPPRTTTQLGFGCAYLLGPGLDRQTSLRLLAAAYDAGIRHFDTARLYGQGQSEALLGEFLRKRPDATVTTKFGIEPPNLLQRGFTAAARRVPALQPAARLLRGSGKVRFTAANARASLERSLRALGREHIDIFLLHEAVPDDLRDQCLLRFLEDAQVAGKIGAFGVGGEYDQVPELFAKRRAFASVLQFEHSIFGEHLELPDILRVQYRTFGPAARLLLDAFQRDRALAWWWSEMTGMDLQEPRNLSRLLLRAALDEYPRALTLFSSSREQHIYDNAAVAQDSRLSDPALRLRRLVHEADPGVRAQLYRSGSTKLEQ